MSRPFGGGEEEEKEERRRGEKSVVFALGSSYTLFRSMTVAILGIEASLASLSPLPPIQCKVSVDCLFGIRAFAVPFYSFIILEYRIGIRAHFPAVFRIRGLTPK